MRPKAIVVALLALTACGPNSAPNAAATSASSSRTHLPSTASSPIPSRPPSSGPLAVMVGTAQSGMQTISLVNRDGKVVASASSPVPDLEPVPFPGTLTAQLTAGPYGIGGTCCGVELPKVSTSKRRAYFASGSNELR